MAKKQMLKKFISEAKQYPFGAINRVVIVKEAQHVRNIEKFRYLS